MLDKINTFLNTRRGQATAAVIDAILFYILASIAIDTANMFAYVAGIVIFFAFISHIVKFIQLSVKRVNK